jgi:hypothetical protein
VPEHHPGQGLDLDVLQAVALDLGKAANLLLGEADVLDLAGRQPLHGRLDLCLGQPEVGRVPLVELAGVLAYCGVAALFDPGQDAFDGLSDLDIGLREGRGILAAFEVSDRQR